jgi:hypothetical protein
MMKHVDHGRNLAKLDSIVYSQIGT